MKVSTERNLVILIIVILTLLHYASFVTIAIVITMAVFFPFFLWIDENKYSRYG